ncbi:hypothetical protein [Thermococcus pacificus]|uniref:Uncharacterized protein n=1 Tax=Thermococcus pacificus TaxID=71998 RepID=A0A218P8A8_9EURY|nr:hypothetical protein [Thermococcus pacificus]ASJ07023.1 hypothetical protein A3L08_06645 [Thermococcus pacificus]
MMVNWKSLLTWAGVGSFVGFAIAVSLYSSSGENEKAVYLIYAGLVAGILLSLKYRLELRASASAFPLGFLATSLLAALWMVTNVDPARIYAFIAVVMAVLMTIGPENYLDMFLAPLSYFGGFAVAMLTFKGYEPLQGTEGAVMSLFVVGVMGAILVFFALFARWAFEMARNISRR